MVWSNLLKSSVFFTITAISCMDNDQEFTPSQNIVIPRTPTKPADQASSFNSSGSVTPPSLQIDSGNDTTESEESEDDTNTSPSGTRKQSHPLHPLDLSNLPNISNGLMSPDSFGVKLKQLELVSHMFSELSDALKRVSEQAVMARALHQENQALQKQVYELTPDALARKIGIVQSEMSILQQWIANDRYWAEKEMSSNRSFNIQLQKHLQELESKKMELTALQTALAQCNKKPTQVSVNPLPMCD